MDRETKRTRDDRDRDSDQKHHRHRDRDRRESDHHHRSDHKSSKREDRESSRDRDDTKRHRTHDRREEREGSRDRVHDRESKRERSREPRTKREESQDRVPQREDRELKREERENDNDSRSKRKEREEEEGAKGNDGEKRARVLGERRERRRFGDKAKEEVDAGELENGMSEIRAVELSTVKQEVNDDARAANGASQKSTSVAPSTVSSMTPGQSLPSKVSSISTKNENKGVSITRFHEVTGKSSTDGTSSAAGKTTGNFSLDALAKAKKALQMQKELAEKLKRLPILNKGASTSDGSQRTVAAKGSVPSAPIGVTTGPASVSSTTATATSATIHGPSGLVTIPNVEAVKRAQEVAAKMGFYQDPEFGPLINMFPGQFASEVSIAQKPTKVPVLRVDALGREIDEHGNIVNVTKPSNLSTLKVNINKQKKDAFQILKPQLDVDPETNPHFDARMGLNKEKLLRPKRLTFQFVDEGKWSKDAEVIKLKNQFGDAKAKELRAKQAQLSKARSDINPNLIEVGERAITKEKVKDPIPEIEWWDLPLLSSGTYGDIDDSGMTEDDSGMTDDKLKMEKITIYVEHPRPIEPPAESAPPPPQPLKLTKKEQKKLRTQRRLAREKERQEMIRQGLLEPPKSKIKMSNLMKVLGAEATQDPTRLEKEIRTAAAEREQAHIDRNIARKLTPAEKREKKEKKLFDDPNSADTIVSVYKINDLSHPKARFKVDVNAQENRLTGCAVISQGISVVVVEGGSKPIKRYGKLMLRRINWVDSVKMDEDDENEDDDKPVNKCVLVWQGIVAKPSFNRFHVLECLTEAAGRKVFADAGVGHYWDLAINFSED